MRMKTFIAAAIVALSVAGSAACAQVEKHPVPSIVQQNGRYALMVDGAPFLMLGAQANNSSDWPLTLPKVWPAIEYLHANTLEIPIYWEQFEPKQGQFHYSQIDSVLAQARAHRVHLVLLWFGTWKNGSQHYMPEWMKLDPERTPMSSTGTGNVWTRPRHLRGRHWTRTHALSLLSCGT